MNKALVGRIWFGIIAVQVILVIPIRMYLSWFDVTGEFEQAWARSVNVLCYFTNQSNLIVGVVCLMLAVNIDRQSTRFVIAELTGLICVIVAGTVYYLMLASEDSLTGIEIPCNFIVHASVPIMFTIGWLVFIPHGNVTWRTVRYSLAFPVGWAIFAMIRGAIISYYPYPFMDVRDLGYPTALINMLVVTLFFVALFIGAYFVDKKLGQRTA